MTENKKPQHKHSQPKQTESKPPWPSIFLITGISLIFVSLIIFLNFPLINPTQPSPTYINLSSVPPQSTFIDLRPHSAFTNDTIGGATNIPYNNCSNCFIDQLLHLNRDRNYILIGQHSQNASRIMINDLNFSNIYILNNYTRWVGPDN